MLWKRCGCLSHASETDLQGFEVVHGGVLVSRVWLVGTVICEVGAVVSSVARSRIQYATHCLSECKQKQYDTHLETSST